MDNYATATYDALRGVGDDVDVGVLDTTVAQQSEDVVADRSSDVNVLETTVAQQSED